MLNEKVTDILLLVFYLLGLVGLFYIAVVCGEANPALLMFGD